MQQVVNTYKKTVLNQTLKNNDWLQNAYICGEPLVKI